MASQSEDAYGAMAHAVDVGCCCACNLFWFDAPGSIGLTPRSTLDLFQYVGRAGKAQGTLASNQSCPRCTSALSFVHDMQRSTRFTYWRCGNDHGQLITFNQFLAEKNFIRPPSQDELTKLRATVRQISCSQCGAPIDLATESACSHCGAPIALIDSDGVAKALHELAAASTNSAPSHEATRAALSDAQVDAMFDQTRMQDRAAGSDDLLAIGAAAIGGLIGAWFVSRV
jgi:hypothetical protein